MTVSLGDTLATVALVFALVTLFLDIAFFLRSESAMQRFVDKQNERADTLNKQQLDTLVKMSEVLAQVSERAKIVQDQVSTQFDTITKYAMNRASIQAESSGSVISEALQREIVKINERVDEVSHGQVPKESIEQIRELLTGFGKQIDNLPDLMGSAARQSVESVAGLNSFTIDDHLFGLAVNVIESIRRISVRKNEAEVSLSEVVKDLDPDDRHYIGLISKEQLSAMIGFLVDSGDIYYNGNTTGDFSKSLFIYRNRISSTRERATDKVRHELSIDQAKIRRDRIRQAEIDREIRSGERTAKLEGN